MFVNLKKIAIVLLLIIYIYNFQLNGVPVVLRTIISAAGIVMALIRPISKTVVNKYLRILLLVICLLLLGIFSMVVNSSDENLYGRTLVNFIACFFAVYFIAQISKGCFKDVSSFLLIVVTAVFVENLLAVMGFLYSGLGTFLLNFQPERALTYDVTNPSDYYRIIGLGNAYYFGVLPSCALGLFSCVYCFSCEKTLKKRVYLMLAFFVISITCFLTARTSVVIIALSLVLAYFLMQSKNIVKLFFFVLAGYILLNVVIVYMKNILPEAILSWAFEFSDNKGSAGTVDELISWWTGTHFDIKTLLIGDAHYTDGDAYYKNVDVGYFRQIYYGGIFCLLIKVLINYKCTNFRSIYKSRKMRYFSLFLFLSYLIIMAKGDADMYMNGMLVLATCQICQLPETRQIEYL